jgi:hypothetical protein
MAIKGLSYSKTNWAFEERPVASSKLNLWDDRIEAALELTQFLLAQGWGGGSGVVRGATADDLAVKATSPTGLSVQVRSGYAFINTFAFKLGAAVTTVAVAAPATNPRKDLVQARLMTWDVSIKTGTEAATPSAPSADMDCVALAELYCKPGMMSIKDASDGTNGYTIDVRNFL